MKFEDIFKEVGLYKAKSFAKHVVLSISLNEIDNRKELSLVSIDDNMNIVDEWKFKVYDGLFDKEYTKIS